MVMVDKNDSEITKAFTWIGVFFFAILVLWFLVYFGLVIANAITN